MDKKMNDLILQLGNPKKRQDVLFLGRTYHVFRDNEYLGEAEYCDDEIHGLGFFDDKDGIIKVFIVDEWILINDPWSF